MTLKLTSLFTLSNYKLLLLIPLSAASGLVATNHNHDHHDIIATLIAGNFPVALSQNLVILLVSFQILAYRPVLTAVSIRNKQEFVQIKLLKLILFAIVIYFIGFYSLFLLSGAPLFHDGSQIIGLSILLARLFSMCVICVLLLGLLHVKTPNILVIIAIQFNFFYHYIIEEKILLLAYSPVYDPLYKAIFLIQ